MTAQPLLTPEERQALMQAIFTVVWNGARAQGFRQSLLALVGGCAYRGLAGRRCNLGLIMPDHIYVSNIENMVAERALFWLRTELGTTPEQRAYGNFFRDADLVAFLCHVQSAHDRSEARRADIESQPAAHERSLRELADRFNLTIPGESNATA